MTTDNEPTVMRRLSRIAVTAGGLALGSVAAPAFAAPPTAWNDPPQGSFLHYVIWLGGITLAIILVITLLCYLPSMIRVQHSDSGTAFEEHPEWFGGPRRGVEATEETVPQDRSKQGGASARW